MYKKEKDAYLHMWWPCEMRQKEWTVIFKEIKEIMHIEIQRCSTIALLNMIGNS